MKFRELTEKPVEELEKTLREERERLRSLRFAVAVSQEGKVRKIRAARKTVARLLTLLTQRRKA